MAFIKGKGYWDKTEVKPRRGAHTMNIWRSLTSMTVATALSTSAISQKLKNLDRGCCDL
jgi:hypothetical protein